jgi:excisionase family DNA binding protein
MTTATRERGLFTIEEAAEYLRISRAGVYRLIDQGSLKRIKLGKSARIPRASLEAFVASLETQDQDNA